MRELYSQLYLDSNCTLPYNDNVVVDDTIGTWATNYFILGVGLAIAIGLAGCCCCSSSTKTTASSTTATTTTTTTATTRFRPILFYFAFTAIGYGIAGLKHQVVHSKTNKLNKRLDPVYYFFVLAGNAFLITTALTIKFPSLMMSGGKNSNCFWKVVVTITLLASHVVVLVLAVRIGQGILGAVLLVTVSVMALFYLMQSCHSHFCWNAMKSLAMLFYAAGLVLQVSLRKTCGDDAYRNCFRNCPLPDATTFNHNALFHILVLASLVFLGIAESQFSSSAAAAAAAAASSVTTSTTTANKSVVDDDL